MIELKNVNKIYGKKESEFNALDDINFAVSEGSTIAIVGKSGSGKSTLMHVMSGLDSATSGEILIDGAKISEMKQKDIDKFRTQKMSFIFQGFFVQGDETCFDNVSLPLEIANVSKKQREEKIKNALRAVDMENKIYQKAKNLSGGQKQRLAVARAIVNNPKILFADEPTGNLDSVTGEVVENLLFNYAKNSGATLVLVTHDDEMAEKCDVKIQIKDGKIQSIDRPKKREEKFKKGSKKCVKLTS